MSKYKPDIKDIINSLIDKGAIIDNKPIEHQEVINSKILFKMTSIEREYLKMLRSKQEIKEAYLETKDWDKVISSVVYVDDTGSQEGFIDYVEEFYNIEVKDSKHLQKLTGCKEYADTQKVKLQDVINTSRYNKYFRTLEIALQEETKYKDLLQIKPQDFGLPKTWSGCLSSDQHSSILWALGFEFMINEPASLMLLPDLRSIAQEIEAPYSVLMDCYKLTNKGK